MAFDSRAPVRASRMLDELMIPLHLAFDLVAQFAVEAIGGTLS